MGQIATDILKRVDTYTKELITYTETNIWEGETSITQKNENEFIDNYIYIKQNNKYYKRLIPEDNYELEMFFNPTTDMVGEVEAWDNALKRLDDFARGRTLSLKLRNNIYNFYDTLNIYSPLKISGIYNGKFPSNLHEVTNASVFKLNFKDRHGVVFNSKQSNGSLFLRETPYKDYDSEGFALENVAIHSINDGSPAELLLDLNEEDGRFVSRYARNSFKGNEHVASRNFKFIMPDGKNKIQWECVLKSKINITQMFRVSDVSGINIGDILYKDNTYVKVEFVSNNHGALVTRGLTSQEKSAIGVQSNDNLLKFGDIITNNRTNETVIVGDYNIHSKNTIHVYTFDNFKGEFYKGIKVSGEINTVQLADRFGSGIVPVVRGVIRNVIVRGIPNIGYHISTLGNLSKNIDKLEDFPQNPVLDQEVRITSSVKGYKTNALYKWNGSSWALTPTIINNNNLMQLDNCTAANCGTYGLFFTGGDSNAGNVLAFSATQCVGYGLYDNSFLGNHIFGLHTSICLAGGIKTGAGIYGNGSYNGIYTESYPENIPFPSNKNRYHGNAVINGGTQGGEYQSTFDTTHFRGDTYRGFAFGSSLDVANVFSRGNYLLARSDRGNTLETGLVVSAGGLKKDAPSLTLVADGRQGSSTGSIAFGPNVDVLTERYREIYSLRKMWMGMRGDVPGMLYKMSVINDKINKIVADESNKISNTSDAKTIIYPYVDENGNLLELIPTYGGKHSKNVKITGRGEYQGLEAIGFVDHTKLIKKIHIINYPKLQGSLTPTEPVNAYFQNINQFYSYQKAKLGTEEQPWGELNVEKIRAKSFFDVDGIEFKIAVKNQGELDAIDAGEGRDPNTFYIVIED